MTNADFIALVNVRLPWLASLPQIGDDWLSGVSGGARAPTPAACEATKTFLTGLQDLCEDGRLVELRRLVLGPLPKGGVLVELECKAFTLFASFLNTDRLDAEFLPAGGDASDVESGTSSGVLALWAKVDEAGPVKTVRAAWL